MPWFLSDAGLQAMGGQITATSLLTTVTASATANAVGTWVALHAAAPFPVSMMRLHLGKTGIAVAASNSQTLVDIGTGPNPTETLLIQDVAIGGALAFSTWAFPVSVPTGTRIVVRLRSAVGSKSVTMGMQVMGGGMGLESGYRPTTYGAVTSGSRGTILTAPGATNTEAAWTVISASTSLPMRWMVVGIASPNTTTATAADHLVDIGVGAASSEAAVVSDIACSISANEEINTPHSLTFPVNIPAGSRLVARYRGTSTSTLASPSVTVTGIC